MNNPPKKPRKNSKPVGEVGALFNRTDELRSDCRMVARILSLGVVSEEIAAACLKGAFTIALESIAGRLPKRNYGSAMAVVLAAARLELESRKEGKSESTQTTVNVQVNNVQQSIPLTEQRRIDEALALLDAARARAVPAIDSAEANEVHPAQTNGTAKPVPRNGVH